MDETRFEWNTVAIMNELKPTCLNGKFQEIWYWRPASQPPICSTLPWSLVKGANLKTVSENWASRKTVVISQTFHLIVSKYCLTTIVSIDDIQSVSPWLGLVINESLVFELKEKMISPSILLTPVWCCDYILNWSPIARKYSLSIETSKSKTQKTVFPSQTRFRSQDHRSVVVVFRLVGRDRKRDRKRRFAHTV